VMTMEQKLPPKYYGFRIYLTSSMLYFFLVFPFLVFLGSQSIPKIAERKGIFRPEVKELMDSLAFAADSIAEFKQVEIDSILQGAFIRGESFADSLARGKGPGGMNNVSEDHGDHMDMFGGKGPFSRYFMLLFFLTLFIDLLGFIYNYSFKRYFRLKRRNRDIPPRLLGFCKRQLLRTPLFNALIIILPNVVVIVYSLVFAILKNTFEADVEKELFNLLFYLSIVATLLEFLFAYYWQKHRVHIRYIDHIFSEEELRVQVFRRKGGKIIHRFLISSGITTFLPLLIVMVYLILSITSVKELGLESLSNDQREILIGPWGKMINIGQGSHEIEKYEKLFYVNAGDSILMVVGIGTGILVSLIYLLLFIRWTSQDITRPVKELLANIRNTRGGVTEQYTIVRTNDEIGELAEGYNEMTRKIHEHVESISRMNRDLEDKVKERTQEVVMQKEEIEAQKEEIEAQLDLATLQRDTISSQKEQILDSIRYAEKIQSAILPPETYLTESLSDHFILFKPRDIVSGDYYWTSLKDDRILIAVADCTGHGVPGAFLSVLGISSMNEIVNRNETIHADQILEHLRTFVIHTLHQTGTRGETQDGIEIALCVIDPVRKTLEFAGANRPLYIVRARSGRKAGAKHEIIHIRGDRMPIGIYDQETVPFTNHEITLREKDTIYLFSDGYVDQLGGPKRKTFRSVHFRDLLLGIQDKSMEEQRRILLETHESWRGEVEQIDDILVVGIRI
jgi:serine phosphatase RsbU (regulator of sigma subunit)